MLTLQLLSTSFMYRYSTFAILSFRIWIQDLTSSSTDEWNNLLDHLAGGRYNMFHCQGWACTACVV